MDELGELISLKADKLIKVIYGDLIQLSAFDPGNEVLQILASTHESKGGESRKDSPCYGRGAYSIRAAGSSHLEFNAKVVKPGQRSQTCDHCLGWNVTSRGYVVKDEPDKVTGRQKKRWQCQKGNARQDDVL